MIFPMKNSPVKTYPDKNRLIDHVSSRNSRPGLRQKHILKLVIDILPQVIIDISHIFMITRIVSFVG